MLNPSRADALTGDLTIARCCGFAQARGVGGIVAVDLFAYMIQQRPPAPARPAPAHLHHVDPCLPGWQARKENREHQHDTAGPPPATPHARTRLPDPRPLPPAPDRASH